LKKIVSKWPGEFIYNVLREDEIAFEWSFLWSGKGDPMEVEIKIFYEGKNYTVKRYSFSKEIEHYIKQLPNGWIWKPQLKKLSTALKQMSKKIDNALKRR
jgi:hypothetical protein